MVCSSGGGESGETTTDEQPNNNKKRFFSIEGKSLIKYLKKFKESREEEERSIQDGFQLFLI